VVGFAGIHWMAQHARFPGRQVRLTPVVRPVTMGRFREDQWIWRRICRSAVVFLREVAPASEKQ
jgi:hypothetical protein